VKLVGLLNSSGRGDDNGDFSVWSVIVGLCAVRDKRSRRSPQRCGHLNLTLTIQSLLGFGGPEKGERGSEKIPDAREQSREKQACLGLRRDGEKKGVGDNGGRSR